MNSKQIYVTMLLMRLEFRSGEKQTSNKNLLLLCIFVNVLIPSKGHLQLVSKENIATLMTNYVIFVMATYSFT